MPRYSLPAFNVPVNIWRRNTFGFGPPDVQCLANLCLGRRTNSPQEAPETEEVGNMWLLLPPGTDIRSDNTPGGGVDVVEVPQWSRRVYLVAWVDDSGGGFANEHRFAALEGQYRFWPLPYPIVGHIYPPPPPPPSSPFLLTTNSTGGVPTNFLTTNSVIGSAGSVNTSVTWQGTLVPPYFSGNTGGAGPGWLSQSNLGGIDCGINLAQAVLPGAMVVSLTVTFPFGTLANIQVVMTFTPGGANTVSGVLSGTSAPLLMSGSTGVTVDAPERVHIAFLEANVGGPTTLSPGAFTMVGSVPESSGGKIYRNVYGQAPITMNSNYSMFDNTCMAADGGLFWGMGNK